VWSVSTLQQALEMSLILEDYLVYFSLSRQSRQNWFDDAFMYDRLDRLIRLTGKKLKSFLVEADM
jgi:hypothetical protein